MSVHPPAARAKALRRVLVLFATAVSAAGTPVATTATSIAQALMHKYRITAHEVEAAKRRATVRQSVRSSAAVEVATAHLWTQLVYLAVAAAVGLPARATPTQVVLGPGTTPRGWTPAIVAYACAQIVADIERVPVEAIEKIRTAPADTTPVQTVRTFRSIRIVEVVQSDARTLAARLEAEEAEEAARYLLVFRLLDPAIQGLMAQSAEDMAELVAAMERRQSGPEYEANRARAEADAAAWKKAQRDAADAKAAAAAKDAWSARVSGEEAASKATPEQEAAAAAEAAATAAAAAAKDDQDTWAARAARIAEAAQRFAPRGPEHIPAIDEAAVHTRGVEATTAALLGLDPKAADYNDAADEAAEAAPLLLTAMS